MDSQSSWEINEVAQSSHPYHNLKYSMYVKYYVMSLNF